MRIAAAPHVADHEWYEATVSCSAACPVHTDAAGYVQAIAAGRFDEAYDLARAHNPFPSVCGRVCSAPCERACRRGVVDAPVAIRALKRVVAEQYGAEHDTHSRWHRAHGVVPPLSRESIGIVGAGPAGLAAAYELRLAGYAVTLYEREREAGGMLLSGIPAFRLPRAVIRAEIASLLSLGIDLVSECRIGEDTAFDTLLGRHVAVLVTVGCARGRGLPLDGAELPGVIRAVDGLRAINAGSLGVMQSPVIVIGGGSVAFDAARSARRTAVTPEGQTALDAARAATRAIAAPVMLIAPEALSALPVPADELHEAAQEGVHVRASMGVRRIHGTTHVESVTIAPIASLFDREGRFRPTLQEGRDEMIPARTVVVAVGQQSDVSFVDASLGLATAPWGGVPCDANGRTANARVYSAGDVSTGPGDLIDAIASGQRAARAIRADLAGETVVAPTVDPRGRAPDIGRPVTSDHRYWSGYDTVTRRQLPVLPAHERAQDDEVERLLTIVDARQEASRCLHCQVHIMLDAPRCIACGLCVDVCPYACIELIPATAGVASVEGKHFALTLDERACIRCGLCVDRCPTDALSMVAH